MISSTRLSDEKTKALVNEDLTCNKKCSFLNIDICRKTNKIFYNDKLISNCNESLHMKSRKKASVMPT